MRTAGVYAKKSYLGCKTRVSDPKTAGSEKYEGEEDTFVEINDRERFVVLR